MKPAVSVLIPTFNYGRFLGGAIASVLAQTFRDFEVIVIDDASDDDTGEVIQRFLTEPRLRYYRTSHLGPSGARNLGLRYARAPLVAFLDADDLWLPRKLERQLKLLRANPEVGVVYTRRLVIDPDGRQLEYQQPPLYRGHVLNEIFHRNFVCFSSSLVRRPVFDQVGYFDQELGLAVDFDFWLRAAARYRFDYVDEPLVKYRTGHANLSSRAEERLATVDRIMHRFLDRRGGRLMLDPKVVRRAFAEIYFDMGLLRRQRSRLAALPCYVRALALTPGWGLAWHGLASLPLPERVRRWFRRALGRPADWSVRKPVSPDQARFSEVSHSASR
jgi:glycosyltransferase involved in cell wall biosynthesis